MKKTHIFGSKYQELWNYDMYSWIFCLFLFIPIMILLSIIFLFGTIIGLNFNEIPYIEILSILLTAISAGWGHWRYNLSKKNSYGKRVLSIKFKEILIFILLILSCIILLLTTKENGDTKRLLVVIEKDLDSVKTNNMDLKHSLLTQLQNISLVIKSQGKRLTEEQAELLTQISDQIAQDTTLLKLSKNDNSINDIVKNIQATIQTFTHSENIIHNRYDIWVEGRITGRPDTLRIQNVYLKIGEQAPYTPISNSTSDTLTFPIQYLSQPMLLCISAVKNDGSPLLGVALINEPIDRYVNLMEIDGNSSIGKIRIGFRRSI